MKSGREEESLKGKKAVWKGRRQSGIEE